VEVRAYSVAVPARPAPRQGVVDQMIVVGLAAQVRDPLGGDVLQEHGIHLLLL
jgi:hypothetical protein